MQSRDLGPLLRQLERRRDAVIHAGFRDRQHGQRGFEIEPCDGQTFADGQQLKIGVRRSRRHRERDDLAVRLRGFARRLRCREQIMVPAP